MHIKLIELENFQCYFGHKVFEFEKGLNIILGANAHGKSKLFNAINWLLNGNNGNIENFISEKAKALKDNFDVLVKLKCERDGIDYSVERLFEVDVVDNKVKCSKSKCVGYLDLTDGSRETRDGEQLIEELFPSVLRKYSLFKGERELNVFDPRTNKDALLNLVNALSDFRTLDSYVDIANDAYNRHHRVLDSKTRKNAKAQQRYNRLVNNRDDFNFKTATLEKKNRTFEDELFKIQKRMEDNISFVESGPQLQKVNSKILKLENDKFELQSKLSKMTNFNADLFDQKWLLMLFNEYQDAFEKKVNSLSRKKRNLTREFDEQRGEIIGKKKLIDELTKTKTPLPIGTPTQEIMEEMLDEEICKVCNRDAPKGSEAYNYMQERLADFLSHIQPELEQEEDEEMAFRNEFIEDFRLLNSEMKKKKSRLNNETLRKEIVDTYEHIDHLDVLIKEKSNEIDKQKAERDKIINKSNAGEETILDAATAIREYNIEIPSLQKKIASNKEKIKELQSGCIETQNEIDKINIEEGLDSENIKTQILRDLKRITQEVKEDVFDGFLSELECKSNEYYTSFGEASSGFTGAIQISRFGGTNDILIKTVDGSSEKDITHTLSSSTVTSINISILMAISSLSTKNSGQSLPMIFDAPTSEFDLLKSIEFYRLCRENFEQSIIMTKDFLEDVGDQKFLVGDNFNKIGKDKAFWVCLDESINPNEMQTVDSQVINL